MKRAVLLAAALMLGANADPSAQQERATGKEESSPEFIGRYDGSSFETAMGMDIRADGTFGWGLSVGALDMRARGTWKQEGDRIILTSDPKPVPPEFGWSGLEQVEGEPFIRVVWSGSGKDFQYASTRITCRNGNQFSGQVHYDGYPSQVALEYEDELPAERDPRKSCDVPETVILIQSIHDVRSRSFNLADLGWTPGQTARFEFRPNDLGVADFTGVIGYLEDGMIKLQGAEWPLEMRKLPPAPRNVPPQP